MALFCSVFMAEYIPYHILFNHSSVDGHLGCFQVLVIANGADMNIWVHVSFLGMAFVISHNVLLAFKTFFLLHCAYSDHPGDWAGCESMGWALEAVTYQRGFSSPLITVIIDTSLGCPGDRY